MCKYVTQYNNHIYNKEKRIKIFKKILFYIILYIIKVEGIPVFNLDYIVYICWVEGEVKYVGSGVNGREKHCTSGKSHCADLNRDLFCGKDIKLRACSGFSLESSLKEEQRLIYLYSKSSVLYNKKEVPIKISDSGCVTDTPLIETTSLYSNPLYGAYKYKGILVSPIMKFIHQLFLSNKVGSCVSLNDLKVWTGVNSHATLARAIESLRHLELLKVTTYKGGKSHYEVLKAKEYHCTVFRYKGNK